MEVALGWDWRACHRPAVGPRRGRMDPETWTASPRCRSLVARTSHRQDEGNSGEHHPRRSIFLGRRCGQCHRPSAAFCCAARHSDPSRPAVLGRDDLPDKARIVASGRDLDASRTVGVAKPDTDSTLDLTRSGHRDASLNSGSHHSATDYDGAGCDSCTPSRTDGGSNSNSNSNSNPNPRTNGRGEPLRRASQPVELHLLRRSLHHFSPSKLLFVLQLHS